MCVNQLCSTAAARKSQTTMVVPEHTHVSFPEQTTEDPVHLQDPQHPFQHHKPHVFLPLTALNMDTNPAGCFLPVYCRSCSFQSKTQFCAPSLLSHSFFTHICSAEFHPPATDVQTRSPAQCPCQPKMEAPLLCHS